MLGTAATPFVVSSNTNLSEEVHRVFFLDWIDKMSLLKEDFIYMPRNRDEYNFVVDEYAEMGLPGCVGSIDCVHIGCRSTQEHVHRAGGRPFHRL